MNDHKHPHARAGRAARPAMPVQAAPVCRDGAGGAAGVPGVGAASDWLNELVEQIRHDSMIIVN